jgi:nicotinate-nucleotide adenylyltransferase
MRPFGVFGGMFDPIHYGHLRTAHELHELLGLERIAFIPAGDPPHRAAPLADAATRLAMVRAAVGEDDRFLVDERELKRAGPSYTVLSLEELRAERQAQPIVLILGMDAFAGLERWHRAGELIGLAHVVVALRPRVARPAHNYTGQSGLINSPGLLGTSNWRFAEGHRTCSGRAL